MARSGWAGLGVAWYGPVRLGVAGLGVAWHGSMRLGGVWCGTVKCVEVG